MASENIEHACFDSAGDPVQMPQLCADWIPNQVFWLLVTLVVIYLILSRVALPRIASVLAERSGTISNDIAAAEELKLKAQEAEAAYEQTLQDARVEAVRIVAEAKGEIQAELDAELATADVLISKKIAESETVIAKIREGSLQSIAQVAEETAGEIVSFFGGTADAQTVKSAVAARLNQ